MEDILNNKTILITGGSGFLAKNLTKYLLKNHNLKKIILFSRNEARQYEAQVELGDDPNIPNNGKIRWIIGDITNLKSVKRVTKNTEIVIHCAALKRIQSGLYNPFEVINTNIIGTQNIITACEENFVEKLIFISSDKAVSPATLYGGSKYMSEQLIQNAHVYSKDYGFSMCSCRYGNVWGSTGSVIPFFQKLIRKGENILPLTDTHMTRFTLSVQRAIETIMFALEHGKNGQIIVPKISSYRLVDLIVAFDCKFKVIGIRGHEKIHEELLSVYENVEDSFNYYIMHNEPKDNTKTGIKYSSDKNDFLTISDLRKLIKGD